MTLASSGVNPAYRVRQRIVIHWFRLTDLRLHDNPALTHSSVLAKGDEETRRCKVIPIFCFDKRIFGNDNLTPSGSLKCGPRRAKFILESVIDLRQRLQMQLKSHLLVAFGKPADIFRDLLTTLRDRKEFDGYEDFELHPEIVCQDEPATEERRAVREVSEVLTEFNPEKIVKRVHRIWGSTLYMPRKMPFHKTFKDVSCRAQGFINRMVQLHKIADLMPVPKYLPFLASFETEMTSYMPTLQDLGYTDEQVALSNLVDPRSKAAVFVGGETAGLARIQEYVWDTDKLKDFARMRHGPIKLNDSTRFSAWLAHGCLSPRFIASEAMRYMKERYATHGYVIAQHDLVKRDFCKYYAIPHSTRLFHRGGPVPQRHGDFQYLTPSRKITDFEAWKNGVTGYPLVDASMRELLATGYITERCRVIAASFLCNDLFHDWRRGAEWFESNLIDYNVFCNWVNWAVCAGLTTGRPFEQKKYNHEVKLYDPFGDYIRLWVPELEHLPEKLVIQPWKISAEEEVEHNFRYGIDYPYRIVYPRFKALKHRNEDDEQIIAEMIKRGMDMKRVRRTPKKLLDRPKPYSALRY